MEISRLAAQPDFPFDPNLIQYVSPIEWHNVVLYGEIRIDPNKLWIGIHGSVGLLVQILPTIPNYQPINMPVMLLGTCQDFLVIFSMLKCTCMNENAKAPFPSVLSIGLPRKRISRQTLCFPNVAVASAG